MKKLTKMLVVFPCLFMAMSAVACSSDGDAIKLTVWCAKEDEAFLKSVQEAYKEANPDKKYKFYYSAQGENDAATKVLNDVQNAPDVFSFASDQINKLVNGDALAQIGGERLTRLQAANDALAMDAATVTEEGQDKVYAMPYTDNTFFLYYDKSKLSESDVASLDGILAKCSTSQQFAMPMNDGWYNTSFYFGADLGYQVTYDDSLGESEITCDFGNERGVKVTTSLWNYVKDARVKADADDSKILAGFQDGSVIAATTGIWNKGKIQEYLGENFAVAKLPTYTLESEQVQLKSFAGYKLIGVSQYSKNRAEALAFAEFYTNQESQLKHFESRGFVPTNLQAREAEAVQNDACARAIAAQLPFTKTQKNVPSTLWAPMQGLGDAMITAKPSQTFDVSAQLLAAVNSIVKQATV